MLCGPGINNPVWLVISLTLIIKYSDGQPSLLLLLLLGKFLCLLCFSFKTIPLSMSFFLTIEAFPFRHWYGTDAPHPCNSVAPTDTQYTSHSASSTPWPIVASTSSSMSIRKLSGQGCTSICGTATVPSGIHYPSPCWFQKQLTCKNIKGDIISRRLKCHDDGLVEVRKA